MKRTKSEYREAIRQHVRAPIRVFFGFDEADEIERLRTLGEPFLFIDHAYFARGYENMNFRLIYNTIHQTKAFDYPADRRKKFSVELKDWNQGERIVFIPAPKNPLQFHHDEKWNSKAIDQLCALSDREIYIKDHKSNGMTEALKNCWAVVTHSSVAGVEAVINGIPVICPDTCPAWPVGADLSKIESPLMPERDKWVNTLTYSQFTLDELKNGYAWDTIKDMHTL